VIPEWVRRRRAIVPLEHEIHERANLVRGQRGLRELIWDEALFAAARSHSEAMRDLNFCGHDSPVRGRETPLARALATGAQFTILAENVLFHERGVTLQLGPVRWTIRSSAMPVRVQARTLVRQWFDSPPHQKNLLGKDWRRSGVGIAALRSGRVYATQLFSD
jgi:uncharacterized protein YkwD